MKKICSLILLVVVGLMVTGCFGRETTTVIEYDNTGTDISGHKVITIEARGDRVRTWEVVTNYNLEEYLLYYGYENADDVREWFAGPGPGIMTFNGVDFELVEITDTEIVTRMFFDYTVISDADRATILGETADFVSLSQSVELHREMGARITEN